jgi:LacI family transcriptional regulator
MAVTLRDIARHLGISHATVSFVLNNRLDMGITEATRQRVLVAAQELGYKPNRAARALTTGRTDMVAVCLPPAASAFHHDLLSEIQTAMGASGTELVVWQPAASKPPSELNVDGFISLGTLVADAEFTNEDGIRKPGVHFGFTPREGWDNVVVDLTGAAVEAFQKMIDAGCRRIAYLRPKTEVTPSDGLYQTFRQLKSTPGISTEEILCNGDDRSSAMAAVLAHVEKWDAPDGIVCSSDHLAIAAKRALSERGVRTPSDVAIVGCGGMEEAEYSWPPLSTIAIPTSEVGAVLWEFLAHRLEWPTDQPQSKVLQARFVARESTAGLKKKR